MYTDAEKEKVWRIIWTTSYRWVPPLGGSRNPHPPTCSLQS
jgi:hypothetical protein